MNNNFIKALGVVGLLSFGPTNSATGQVYLQNIFPEEQQTDTLFTTTVEAFDVDNDGDNDLIIGNDFKRNTILYNDGEANFSELDTFPFLDLGNITEDLVMADFNQDSLMDFLFINQGGAYGHEYYLNSGDGTFSVGILNYPSSRGSSADVADINGDGYPDVLIGNIGEPNACLIADSLGSFTNEADIRLPDGGGDEETNDVVFGDVDGDGDLDIFVANNGQNRLLLNDGTGVFTDETIDHLPISTGTTTRTGAFGDIDNDGDLDLYLGNVQFDQEQSDFLNRVYINDGTGVFADETETFLPPHPNQTTNSLFYDINNDGYQDIIISNVLSEGVQIYFNRLNDGSHYEILTDSIMDIPVGTEYEIWGFTVANLDGDTIPDLYVPNRTGHHFWYKGVEGDIVSSVKTTVVSTSFKTYPNPINATSFYVDLDGLTKNRNTIVNLFNLQGQKVSVLELGEIVEGKTRINLPETVENGWYLLSINQGDKQYNSKIIVKR